MSSDSGPAARPYGRRADAERNRESVLDHAAHLLSDDPAIGMAEIANASGIGRATLYRHFPTRELLIAAIIQRALDDAENAIAASRLEEGTAAEALHRLIVALLNLGDRYRFLLTQAGVVAPGELRTMREERLFVPVSQLLERGQEGGEFSRSLSPAWMATVVGVLIVAAVSEIAVGRFDEEQAVEAVMQMIVHGIGSAGG
jgi:TetR/AcrR family transcriptional repressor of mexCD-oprJ operon